MSEVSLASTNSGGRIEFSLWNMFAVCLCARRRKKRSGSQASLVQNDHFSSVNGSKRILTSQETIAEAASRPELQANDSCGPLVRADSDVPGANDFGDVQSRTSPSYLKLSKAIGGYTPYNAYVSVAEHEKRQTEKNAGRKKVSSGKQHKDTEVTLLNGDTVVAVKQPFQAPVYGSTSTGDCSVGGASVSNGVSYGGNIRPSGTSASVLVAGVQDQNETASCALSSRQDVPSVKLLPQDKDDGCCARVASHSEESGSADGEVLRSPLQPSVTNSADTDFSQKDGQFFLNLVAELELRLKDHCSRTEQDLLTKTSDEAEGKMRAAVGKANLLIRKKFQQFRQLCHATQDQKEDEPFKTTVQDLSGYWDMMLIQVEDVEKQFEEIGKLREAGWKETNVSESLESVTPTRTPGSKVKTPKSNTSATTKSPSSSSSAAAKARDEARQRLMAAKAAGRQRKASESDKDIEIFVS